MGAPAALEILINRPRIKKLILEGDTTKIPAAIQASRTEGMQTFNQALVDLVKTGKVEEAEALQFSPKPDELKMNLKGIFSGTRPGELATTNSQPNLTLLLWILLNSSNTPSNTALRTCT